MTINEIYQDIEQRIFDSINEEWQIAKLFIDRLEGYISVDGEYINEAGIAKKIKTSLFGYLFSINIHELHSITTDDSKKWNKLRVILLPGGKLDMEFIWDQEYQDEIDHLNKK